MQFSLKYRPKSFSEVTGHEYLMSALRNSIFFNRVPNALIFCGPKGVGKTSIARIFAKALNCPNFHILKDVCNECSGCLSIQNSKALDYVEIDAASHRGIDDIRNLEKIISLKNFALDFKVIVLDEAHMITETAWNALLKTIEEPPPNIKIILATTDVEKLPVTIISRCQKFDFKPLSKKNIVDNLKKVCEEEKIKYSENVLDRLAHYAKGSLRDAQILLEQVFVSDGAVQDINLLFTVLGTCNEEDIANLFDYIVSADNNGVFGWIDEKLPKIYNMNVFCDELLDYVDKLLTQKYVDRPIMGSNMYQFKIKSQVDKVNVEKLIIIAKILLELKSKLYYFDNPELLVKTFLIKLSMIDNFLDLEKICSIEKSVETPVTIKHPKLIEDKKTAERLAMKSDALAKSDKIQPSVTEESTVQLSANANLDDVWFKILQEIKIKHILTYNMLKSAKILEINNKFIKLGYTNKNNEQYYFKKEKTQELLKNVIQKITGTRLDIVFEMMDVKITEELLENKSFARFYDAFKGKIEIE